jgi:hypothetical protein
MAVGDAESRGEAVLSGEDGGGNGPGIETLSVSDETGEWVGFEDGDEW